MAIQSWSTTASDNDDADATINWAEGQNASSVNNSARAMMAAIAAWRDAFGGAKTTGGSSNAYTLTTGLSLSSLVNGFLLGFEANHTNTGASTIAIDGLTTKPLITPAGAALSAGQITAGGIYLCSYETGADSVVVITASAALGSMLTAIAALTPTDGNIIVGDGATWVAESGATARTSLGLGTGNSPQFTAIELGHASANTLTASGGDLSIEGNAVYRAGGTDVPVADGGTGSSTASAARTALGVAIGTDVMAVPTTGQLPVGSCALLRYTSSTAVANGGTTSGANLDLATALGQNFTTGGTTQTGTWTNISGVTQDDNGFNDRGYWVRTA